MRAASRDAARLPCFLLLAGLALVLVPDSALAAKAAPVRILAVEEPPSSFTGTDGKPTGYSIDVVRAMQARLGDHTNIEMAPESRVFQTGLRNANVVLIAFSRTPEREKDFNFLVRVAHKPWIFYGRRDNVISLRSLADVRALSAVAVVSGDVRAQWLKQQGGMHLFPVENHAQAIQLLLAHRVDALFSEPQSVAWYCHQNACGDTDPVPLWSPRASDVYLLMSKHGTATETLQRWQTAADAVRNDGTLDTILRQWSDRARTEFGVDSIFRDGVIDFCTAPGRC